MGPPPGALPSSSQSLHLKVKTSKKLDSSCQQPPVPFLPVPSNEQYFFFLMWQWMAFWCFLVFIINISPFFLITRYQLLLPTTPSPHPWELMAKATFSIFPFRPFLYALQTLCSRAVVWLHTKCEFDWFFLMVGNNYFKTEAFSWNEYVNMNYQLIDLFSGKLLN